jgi:hypothetical protein
MRFWKEKSVEDTVTLGPTARATLVFNKFLTLGTSLKKGFGGERNPKERVKTG